MVDTSAGQAPVEPARASTASTAARAPGAGSSRLAVVDWLRGFATLLMIQTHLFDAWVSPAGKTTASYHFTRFLGGIPSRLFLMLVGVSMALRFESMLAKGVTRRRAYIAAVQKRGLEILGLAYVFRLQEYVLGHMSRSIADLPAYWRDLLRIDILNCIGMSMVLVPYVAAPMRGRPAWRPILVVAGIVIALGPVVGPAVFPSWIPVWLSSYVGGQRPHAWFPLFPWAAWSLLGVAIGHIWVRAGRDPRREKWTFIATGVIGMILIQTVQLIRNLDPTIIRYPSELVQQMGPGSFFYRLGMNGVVALLGWTVVHVSGRRFSAMQLFGRTSLLVYWIHIDLCYGLIAHRLGLFGRLGMPAATVGFVGMVLLMLAIAWLKTTWSSWSSPRSPGRRAAELAGPVFPR
jgi:uncharacterized membrane protein